MPGDRKIGFHFTKREVLDAVQGTEYLKTCVERRLNLMTTGEAWSLYRAIAKLAWEHEFKPIIDAIGEISVQESMDAIDRGL